MIGYVPVVLDGGRCNYSLTKTVDGLSVGYDDTGPYPSVTVSNPDGEIELRGLDEILAAAAALSYAANRAVAFRPPLLQRLARHA